MQKIGPFRYSVLNFSNQSQQVSKEKDDKGDEVFPC